MIAPRPGPPTFERPAPARPPRARGARGHVLGLVMVLLAAIATGGLLFAARIDRDLEGREGDDVRVQALWLARSAVDAGVTGTRTVPTPAGPATVRVARSGGSATAEVRLAGAFATVAGDPPAERIVPAPD